MRKITIVLIGGIKMKVVKAFSWVFILAGLLAIFVGELPCYAEPRIILTEPPEGMILNYLAQDKIVVAGEIGNISRFQIIGVLILMENEEYGWRVGARIFPAELTTVRLIPPLFGFRKEVSFGTCVCSSSCITKITAELVYRRRGGEGVKFSQPKYFCMDRLGPSLLEIDSPINGQIFAPGNIGMNGRVWHECSAWEGYRRREFSDILDHFDIKVDGTKMATGLRHFSYSGGTLWRWNHTVRVFGEGEHEITVVFYDKIGKEREGSVRIKIDNTPPTIRVLSPRSGEKIKSEVIPATITVSAEVRDEGRVASGVGRVEFWANGRKLTERRGPIEDDRFAAPLSGLREGWNEITVKAYDKVENHSSVGLRVYIERTMKGLRPKRSFPTGPQIQPQPEPIRGGRRPR